MTAGLLAHSRRRDRRLRVVHIVPDLGVGGAERHVTTLMPALNADRFEPSVICIGEKGALFSRLTAHDVPAIALGRTKRSTLPALVELVRELRRLRPDVVLVRGYNAEVLGRVAAYLTRVPATVVRVHNMGDAEPRGRLRHLLDRALDRITNAYFGVARAQIDYISGDLGLPAGKVRIIHNGVDPACIDPRSDRGALASLGIGDEPVVALVAAMRPEKDHDVLDGGAPCPAKGASARFMLVGDGPTRREVEAHAASLGLGDRGSSPAIATTYLSCCAVLTCSCSRPTPSSASQWRYLRPWSQVAPRCVRRSVVFPR